VISAEQAVENAQKQLENATITAPFDGTVALVAAKEEDTILTTTPIIHLVDFASMQLRVDIDEIDVPLVNPGQKTKITVDALPERQFEGEVTFISLLPKIEAGIVSYEATIALPAPGAVLKIGMSATADIIAEHHENVLIVPSQAVDEDEQGNTSVRIVVDGEVQERPVVTGISDGFQTEIVSGLQEGDMILLETRTGGQSGLFF
jgi:RND family efflux transporter MFP subunit